MATDLVVVFLTILTFVVNTLASVNLLSLEANNGDNGCNYPFVCICVIWDIKVCECFS